MRLITDSVLHLNKTSVKLHLICQIVHQMIKTYISSSKNNKKSKKMKVALNPKTKKLSKSMLVVHSQRLSKNR
jgi:hypothetical protein